MFVWKLTAIAIGFSPAACASRSQLRQGSSKDGASRWWGEDEEHQDAAYQKARRRTKPSVGQDNDKMWFQEAYANDKKNKLLELTLSVPDTLPTKEQVAESEAKELAAAKELKPRLIAEEVEAANFYHNVFTHDSGNQLEAFTLGRSQSQQSNKTLDMEAPL
mmetsp:Transcript_98298/g.227923  ORF Transcript_98298/g.227923 Transcript_98298/m.227923 type:complete len:162 (-) Transcript_98298:71-556(-)